MNLSTDGVTLSGEHILVLLEQYRHLQTASEPILDRVRELGSRRKEPVPLSLYNDVCQWIEQKYGAASLREAGRALGKRAYERMVGEGHVGLRPTPNRVFQELRRLTPLIIQDPLQRGWELLEDTEQKVRLRRTQTFNCMLQEGILLSLLEGTGVVLPRVTHARCTRHAAAFCEYDALWLQARPFPTPRPSASSMKLQR